MAIGSRLTIKQPSRGGDEEVDPLAELLGFGPSVCASDNDTIWVRSQSTGRG